MIILLKFSNQIFFHIQPKKSKTPQSVPYYEDEAYLTRIYGKAAYQAKRQTQKQPYLHFQNVPQPKSPRRPPVYEAKGQNSLVKWLLNYWYSPDKNKHWYWTVCLIGQDRSHVKFVSVALLKSLLDWSRQVTWLNVNMLYCWTKVVLCHTKEVNEYFIYFLGHTTEQ